MEEESIFDRFYISETDFKFFKSLREDEKIFFMHDLLCLRVYGNGSTDLDDLEPDDDYTTEDSEEYELQDFEGDLDQIISNHRDQLIDVVNDTVTRDHMVTSLAINEYIIFNSDNVGPIIMELEKLLLEGYVYTHVAITDKISDVFKRQKYCIVVQIVGRTDFLCTN